MRFVHLQRIGVDDHAINHQAIAGLNANDLVFDHCPHRHLKPIAITQTSHRLLRERSQPIQLSLGVELLNHAEEGIGYHAEAGEEGGGVITQGDDDDEHAAQHHVEQVEHIFAENLPIAAPDPRFKVVALAALMALQDLALAKAGDFCAGGLAAFDRILHDSFARYIGTRLARIRNSPRKDVACQAKLGTGAPETAAIVTAGQGKPTLP